MGLILVAELPVSHCQEERVSPFLIVGAQLTKLLQGSDCPFEVAGAVTGDAQRIPAIWVLWQLGDCLLRKRHSLFWVTLGRVGICRQRPRALIQTTRGPQG